MAKRRNSSKRPQAQHKPKSRSSQHDKRKRLEMPNPRRKRTLKAKVPLTGKMAVLVASMTGMLNARMAFRLSIIMAGMMLADDCRVAAAWFAAAGVQDDWDRFDDCLISVGRRTRFLALRLMIRQRGDTDGMSKARACIIIQRPVRLMANGCTATTGCHCVS